MWTDFINPSLEKYTKFISQRKQSLTINRIERAAQEYEQAARGEFHVAVAQATKKCRAEMREITSRQVMSMNEVNSVASDVPENQRSLLHEARTELQRHQRQNHEDLQEYSARCSTPSV